MMTAPAAFRRSTTMSSSSGTKSLYRTEPMTVLIPLVATRSLMPTGTPASGPTASPFASLASIDLAAARACSGAGVQNACTCGSSTSMRRSNASVASSADRSLALMRRARVRASIRQISLSLDLIDIGDPLAGRAPVKFRILYSVPNGSQARCADSTVCRSGGAPRAGGKAGCRPAIPAASENENLSRVHDVVGVDRTFDGAHQVERRSELVLEIGHLALADAVLAGTGAVHGDGAGRQSIGKCLHPFHLVGVVAVEHHGDMEIAVADMTHDRPEQAAAREIVLGRHDAIGEARNRHADVGWQHVGTRLEHHAGEGGVVPRLPEVRAFLG